MADHRVDGLLYGHFGDGCMHVRINMPLDTPEGIGPSRDFLVASAELVTSYGGALSGEHGAGRARSELLPLMDSPGVLETSGEVTAVFAPAAPIHARALVRHAAQAADAR